MKLLLVLVLEKVKILKLLDIGNIKMYNCILLESI